MATRGKGRHDEVETPPYFSPPVLLTPPVLRAAYSDRTAWIMAKAAQLAYLRFEDNDDERQELEASLASGGFTADPNLQQGRHASLSRPVSATGRARFSRHRAGLP